MTSSHIRPATFQEHPGEDTATTKSRLLLTVSKLQLLPEHVLQLRRAAGHIIHITLGDYILHLNHRLHEEWLAH